MSRKRNKELKPLYPVIKNMIQNFDRELLKKYFQEYMVRSSRRFENVLTNNKIHFFTPSGYDGLRKSNITEFCDTYEKRMFAEHEISEIKLSTTEYVAYFKNRIFNEIEKELKKNIDSGTRKTFKKDLKDLLSVRTHTIRDCVRTLRGKYPFQKAIELLSNNRNYINFSNSLKETATAFGEFHRSILADIETPYPETFPETRKRTRHFVLHIGPTNSGKTYEAIQALKKAETGVYLAPLRLLAYEIFDQLNKDGVYCDMLTGEEEIQIPFSTHTSSTIEMLDFSKEYDVAVIDEVQMIADRQRGSSWTNAIVGVNAREVHVCAANHAEDILVRIITECHDTYELHKTERSTELIWQRSNKFDLRYDTLEGDALIVFSRKDVHAVSAELKMYGKECSIIYGNLPYNIRHEEARKFNDHETRYVVATDAIGMGLNMPIKRIVFLRTEKYDGITRRPLKPEEIQQIAGRAGRFGIYDKGFVTSVSGFRNMKRLYDSEVPQITSAVISFPEKFTELGLDLSLLLRRWADMVEKQGYIKCDLSEQIKLCRMLEDLTKDKKLIFSLITIPFDVDLSMLLTIWRILSNIIIKGEALSYTSYLPVINDDDDMQALEEDYKLCDMLYSFQRKFPTSKEEKELIAIRKQEISERIEELIEEKALECRICRSCGRKLPWNYEYGLCEKCYRKEHQGFSLPQ